MIEEKPAETETGNNNKVVKDNEMLKALGDDPTIKDSIEVPIDDELVKRWAHWVKNGLLEENLAFLLSQYDIPEFLQVPILNPELKSYLHENAKIRDKHLADAQNLTAMSITSLGSSFVILMDEETNIEKEIKRAMLEMLTESIQLQTQLFFEQTETRKAFIKPAVKNKKIKEMMGEQETDKYLFGKDLDKKIRAIDKTDKKIQKISNDEVPEQNKKTSKAKDFLLRRAGHPRKRDQYLQVWCGQHSQRDRWPYKNNRAHFSIRTTRRAIRPSSRRDSRTGARGFKSCK